MKTLRILTLVFNLFIVIGAGHGIGILGFVEIMTVRELFTGEFNFNLTGHYDDRLMTVGLFSIIGQSFLISSFFFDDNLKSRLTIVGCLILLITTYILTKDSKDLNLDMFSLMFSIPFIGTALILLIKELLTIQKLMTTQ